jgi:hypothetical protein
MMDATKKHLEWLNSNFVIALFTVVLAGTSWLQWKALIDANTTGDKNLVLSQRAYLTIGKPEGILPGVRVPVRNFGHAPAKLLEVPLEYMRVDMTSNVAIDRHRIDTPPGAVAISPGEASNFALMLTLPILRPDVESLVKNGHQKLLVSGKIRFDTGFKDEDTVLLNLVYEQDGWKNVNEGIERNLRN